MNFRIFVHRSSLVNILEFFPRDDDNNSVVLIIAVDLLFLNNLNDMFISLYN